jgi:hypothetical protein
MKINRNFLLIVWAAALVGLFAGVEAVHAEVEADAENGVYVPKEFGLYLIKDGKESPLTVDPSNFVDTVTNYHAYVPVRADSVYLGIKWVKEDRLSSEEKKDSISVKVTKGDSEADVQVVYRTTKDNEGDGALKDGKYDGHYDRVYLIKFTGKMEDRIEGKLSFEVPGMGKFEYNLTIDRVAANNISDLVKLFVVANADKDKWEAPFKIATDINLYDPDYKSDSIFFSRVLTV